MSALELSEKNFTTRPTVSLDPDAKPRVYPSSLNASPNGTWAVLIGTNPSLYVGDFSEPEGHPRWHANLDLTQEQFVTLHPFDTRHVIVCVFTPSRRESTVLRFDPDGKLLGSHTVTSLELAVALDPDTVLHQTNAETVTATTLSNGHQTVYNIPIANHGMGRLFGDGSAPYFLPWDAEDVVDLIKGKAISRKLAPADGLLRHFLREQLARANALAMPAGRFFELSTLDLNTRHSECSYTWAASIGNGSLLGELTAGWLRDSTRDVDPGSLGNWRTGSSNITSFNGAPTEWTDADVNTALSALESSHVPVLHTLQGLAGLYGYSHGHAIYRATFTQSAARLFLSAIVWSLSHSTYKGCHAGARDLAASLGPDTVISAVKSLPATLPPHVDYNTLGIIALLSVNALHADAVAPIAEITCAIDAWRGGLYSFLESALRWLFAVSPNPLAVSETLRTTPGAHPDTSLYLSRALT